MSQALALDGPYNGDWLDMGHAEDGDILVFDGAPYEVQKWAQDQNETVLIWVGEEDEE